MKLQHETVKYFVEDALVEIKKILEGCEKKTLDDVELKVLLGHALDMFHFVYNAKYLTRKKVNELPQEEFEKMTLLPEDFIKD